MTEKTTKRQLIRRAAYACFRDHGWHAASVDMICKTAGISKGSYYWHFSSKQEVFVEILDTWTQEVMDQLFEQFETASQSEDYVGAITAALEREAHRGRAIIPLWVEFTALAPHEPEVREALSRFYRRIRQAVTELLRPLLGAAISEDELHAVAATAFAAFTGLILQDLADPEADASSALTRFMSAIRVWADHARPSTGDDHDRPSR